MWWRGTPGMCILTCIHSSLPPSPSRRRHHDSVPDVPARPAARLGAGAGRRAEGPGGPERPRCIRESRDAGVARPRTGARGRQGRQGRGPQGLRLARRGAQASGDPSHPDGDRLQQQVVHGGAHGDAGGLGRPRLGQAGAHLSAGLPAAGRVRHPGDAAPGSRRPQLRAAATRRRVVRSQRDARSCRWEPSLRASHSPPGPTRTRS